MIFFCLIYLGQQNEYQHAWVEVDSNDEKYIMENNRIGSNLNFINNGSGILNTEYGILRPRIIDTFQKLSLKSIRFPGGSLSDQYHWWYGLGNFSTRPIGINGYTGQPTNNNYGILEHYQLCQNIGASITITVNYETGTPVEAANWVEFCNGVIPVNSSKDWRPFEYQGNESAPLGYFSWLRGQLGYVNPLGIKMWEVGNEVYSKWTNSQNSTQYSEQLRVYINEMKKRDNSIKIAAIGYEFSDGIWNGENLPWNDVIIEKCGDVIDALHIHTYGPVSEDGQTIFFFTNYQQTFSLDLDHSENCYIEITFCLMNSEIIDYPNCNNGYVGVNISITGLLDWSFLVLNSKKRSYRRYFSMNNPYKGDIVITCLNISNGNVLMMDSLISLYNESNSIKINLKNYTKITNGNLAFSHLYTESILHLKEKIVRLTQRKDIDIWVTEFNSLFGVKGFGIHSPLKLSSSIAVAGLVLSYINIGVKSIQHWSMIDDFYFGLVTNYKTMGLNSMYHVIRFINPFLFSKIKNVKINAPLIELDTKVGIYDPIMKMNPIIGVFSEENNSSSLLIANINRESGYNITISISSYLTSECSISVLSSSNPDSLYMNSNVSDFKFGDGIVGKAVNFNGSSVYQFLSESIVFDMSGTIEFWIKPNWNGDCGIKHPILSIGNTFQILYSDNKAIVVVLTNDEWNSIKLLYYPVSSWKQFEWHHIAVSWNSLSNFILYIDGQKVMSESLVGFSYYFDPQITSIIGSTSFDIDLNSDSFFDEFRVSKIDRTNSSIFASFNHTKNHNSLPKDIYSTMILHFDDNIYDEVNNDHIKTETFDARIINGTINLNMNPSSLVRVLFNQTSNPPNVSKNNTTSSIVIICSGLGILGLIIFLTKKVCSVPVVGDSLNV